MRKNSYEKYELRTYKPEVTLERFIDEFYEFDFIKPENMNANPYFFPNYTTALIYFTDKISGKYDFYFAGPCIKKVFLPTSSNCSYWAVDFHPFVARQIFNFNIKILLNNLIPAGEILYPGDYNLLRKSFNKDKSCIKRIKFFEKFVSERINNVKIPAETISGFMGLVENTSGNLRLKEIYRTMTASTRQFQRKFLEETGLTPKEFCRIVRIRSAANKLAEGNYKHLDILYESGYYDQSHYNKEFKELSGVTPSSFEKRTKKIKKVIK